MFFPAGSGVCRIQKAYAFSALVHTVALLSPFAVASAAAPPVPIPAPVHPPTPQSPATMPAIAIPGQTPSVAPPTAGDFVLSEVLVEGSTIFGKGELEPLYRDYLGRRVGIDAVSDIVAKITAKYRESGFFLSHAVAPPQSLSGGVLHVRVIEGYIDKATVGGASAAQEQTLLGFAARVESERPLRLATLERVVLLTKDLPGVAVTPSIAPIDEASGRYELVLTVDLSPVSGYVASDNRGAVYLGPWQVEAHVAAASLAAPFDQLSAAFFTVPNLPRELLAGEIAYGVPIGSDGLRGSVAVARSGIHPGDFLAHFDLSGITTSYLARISYPLLRGHSQSLWIGGAFNAVESREAEPGVLLFDDHLRVVRGDATYLADDPLGGSSKAFLQVSEGLHALGASHHSAATVSTPGGHPAFTKVTGAITRDQSLFDNFSLFFDVAGQKADVPLLLSEQFALGGARFGRGYDPAAAVGDDALAGAVELRYGHDLSGGVLRSFQVYAFYDIGTVWNISANNPQRSASLSSVGGGARLALAEGFFLSLELARPLTRPLVPNADKPLRVFARLAKNF